MYETKNETCHTCSLSALFSFLLDGCAYATPTISSNSSQYCPFMPSSIGVTKRKLGHSISCIKKVTCS